MEVAGSFAVEVAAGAESLAVLWCGGAAFAVRWRWSMVLMGAPHQGVRQVRSLATRAARSSPVKRRLRVSRAVRTPAGSV